MPRYVDLEKNAKQKAMDTVTSELNARESLTWVDSKISTIGYVSDTNIFGEVNFNLGSKFRWNLGDPKVSGGTLQFEGESFPISRTASSYSKPAVWKQN